MCFLPKNTCFLVKKSYGFGGYPPLRTKIPAERGLQIWGTPPPFTDKIRKVVFDGLPYIPVNSLHHIFYVSDFYVYEVGKRLFSEYHNICISISNHKLACQKLKLKIQLRKNFPSFCFRTFSLTQGLIEKSDLGGWWE